MPVRFRRQQVSAEAFESADVFDVDGDGVPDIVSGGYWYRGPDFHAKHVVDGTLRRYGDYYDDFSTIPMDVDGDGRLDVVTGGWFGESLRWRQNPGKADLPWPEHLIAANIGPVETTRAWDVDGDGELEVVPNTPNTSLCAYKLVRDGSGRPTGRFAKHVLFPEGVGHGLGFGDADGDGRGEFVTPRGILKPTGRPLGDPWAVTEPIDFGHWDLSIPILVVDVNGDGVNELVVGHAHNYGLDWYDRRPAPGGTTTWVRHPIDPFNAQYHDLLWADIDGDGTPELVTGKRHLAHCGRDPGERDDLGLYYFKWTGEGFAKQVIAYGPEGVGAGCGIYFRLADLRGTGRLDVVAPGKDGLQVFWNEGST